MFTKLKSYQESGKFKWISPIVLFVFGLIGSLTLGFVYSYAIRYIPIIYLNVVIALGFGLLMGMLTSFAGKWTHVRNKKLLGIMGFVNGCMALYVSWVVWIHLFADGLWIIKPGELWEAIKIVNEYGTWGIGRSASTSVSGMFLSVIWAIEAAIIVFLSTGGAMTSGVYCEDCGKWIDEEVTKEFELEHLETQNGDEESSEITPTMVDIDTIKEAIECGDFSHLEKMVKVTDTTIANKFLVVKYAKCNECHNVAFLTLEKKEIKLDKKGKKETNNSTLLEKLMISKDMYNELESL